MNQDISELLAGWEFNPHELTVRIIRGGAGDLLQMRIELGVIQMCMEGRPDGFKPFDSPSLLDHYEKEAKAYGKGYHLEGDVLDELHREGYQYYQRYLCLYQLGDYDAVVRDTERNLRLFDFVKRFARRRRDQWRFERHRPYLLMMNTRAKAMKLLGRQEKPKAIEVIEEGRRAIFTYLREHKLSPEAAATFEIEFLTQWKEDLEAELSGVDSAGDSDYGIDLNSPRDLRKLIDRAVQREDYETAAELRDRLRRVEPDLVNDQDEGIAESA
jgi:hypothetical protein